MAEHTCGNCHNVKYSRIINTVTAYCGETVDQLLIPHMSDPIDKSTIKMTFTCIPIFCPRTGVEKSGKLAAKRYHVTKDLAIRDIQEVY